MPEGPGLPRVTISCSEIVTLPGYVAYAMPLVALNFSLLEELMWGKQQQQQRHKVRCGTHSLRGKRPMKLLGLILLLLSACSMQAQVVPPALPKAHVNIAMPTQGTKPCPTLTTGSNCIRATRPGNAADFQAAMNAATCGDTIVLTAGSTYRGNFRVPPSSAPCSGWVLVVSTGLRNSQ